MFTLENESIIIKIKPQGAELSSIFSKITNKEYLWDANPAYWNRHAPVLFPIVGRLVNDTYYHEGKEYSLPQHGFGRDMTFDIIHQDKTEVTYEIQSSEETLIKYPFSFKFHITYRLIGNALTVEYKVINLDSTDMYFSVGAHPAFHCPVDSGTAYFSFAEVENLDSYVLEGPYRKPNKETIQEPADKLDISVDLFKNDVKILENMNTNEITLRTTSDDTFVKMTFDGFPMVGLWSRPTGAPFVCIEPWYGVCDALGDSVELKDKKGIQKLSGHDTFVSSYDIIVG